MSEKWKKTKFAYMGLGFAASSALCALIIYCQESISYVLFAIITIAGGVPGSILASMLSEKNQTGKPRVRSGIAFVVSTLIVIGAQFLPSIDTDAALGPPPSLPAPPPTEDPDSHGGSVEQVVPTPFQETLNEIGTAVSFNTPQQIENGMGQDVEQWLDLSQFQDLFILSASFRSEITDPEEYYMKAHSYLEEYVNSFAHSRPNCPADEINGNSALSQLLESANDINRELQIRRDIDLYETLMEKYELAYQMAQSSSISLQLARPYAEIVEIYPRDNPQQCQKIFQYGVLGIRYFLETLSYEDVYAESDGDLLYRIGQIYHYLGDVPALSVEARQELYVTASIFLDLASELGADDYEGYSVYYAGMVNHKLGVISDEDNSSYLLRASDRYQQALYMKEHFSNALIGDIHKFYSDVYDRLGSYVQLYGRGKGLASSEEYFDRARAQHDEYVFYKSHA